MGKQCPRPWAEGGERALGRPWPGGHPSVCTEGRGSSASSEVRWPLPRPPALTERLTICTRTCCQLCHPGMHWACLPPAATFSREALTPPWCRPQPSVAPTALRTEPGPDCPPEVSAAGPGLAVPSCHSSSPFTSVAQSRPTLCHPIDCSTPGFPVRHQIPGLAQTHVH